ncbi:hypothetical protein C7M84_019701 [Penaeus vannamei]|uniref:Uncharacterized protein n=1 Tax=Penaeus vannamei TaxID=6689 RepID=A0A3R7LYJ0_PENVA|nr:hypothetical protein C7M84_019701 [Penaeus vannamei]
MLLFYSLIIPLAFPSSLSFAHLEIAAKPRSISGSFSIFFCYSGENDLAGRPLGQQRTLAVTFYLPRHRLFLVSSPISTSPPSPLSPPLPPSPHHPLLFSPLPPFPSLPPPTSLAPTPPSSPPITPPPRPAPLLTTPKRVIERPPPPDLPSPHSSPFHPPTISIPLHPPPPLSLPPSPSPTPPPLHPSSPPLPSPQSPSHPSLPLLLSLPPFPTPPLLPPFPPHHLHPFLPPFISSHTHSPLHSFLTPPHPPPFPPRKHIKETFKRGGNFNAFGHTEVHDTNHEYTHVKPARITSVCERARVVCPLSIARPARARTHTTTTTTPATFTSPGTQACQGPRARSLDTIAHESTTASRVPLAQNGPGNCRSTRVLLTTPKRVIERPPPPDLPSPHSSLSIPHNLHPLHPPPPLSLPPSPSPTPPPLHPFSPPLPPPTISIPPFLPLLLSLPPIPNPSPSPPLPPPSSPPLFSPHQYPSTPTPPLHSFLTPPPPTLPPRKHIRKHSSAEEISTPCVFTCLSLGLSCQNRFSRLLGCLACMHVYPPRQLALTPTHLPNIAYLPINPHNLHITHHPAFQHTRPPFPPSLACPPNPPSACPTTAATPPADRGVRTQS